MQHHVNGVKFVHDLGLSHSARKAIKQQVVSVVVLQKVNHQVAGQVVGHELAFVDVLLGLFAQIRSWRGVAQNERPRRQGRIQSCQHEQTWSEGILKKVYPNMA